jgi:hypothetical protein
MVLFVESGVGGSIHPLSPIEGKFRVKGDGVVMERGPLFLTRKVPRIKQIRAFGAFETRSSSFAAFFAWQDGRDYRQCVLINTCVFPAESAALGSANPRDGAPR